MTEHDENKHDVAERRHGADPLSGEERRVWDLERFDDLPMCMSLEMAGTLLGVSRSTAYKMRTAGTIRALQLRGRWTVTRHELLRLILGSGPDPTSA